MDNFDEKQINQLKRLMTLMEPDGLTKQEFIKSFQEVIKLVVKVEGQLVKKINTLVDEKVSSGVSSLSEMKQEMAQVIQDVKKSNDSTFVSMRQRAMEAMTNMFSRLNVKGQMDKMMSEHDKMMSDMEAKIEEIKREEIKFPEPPTAVETRDKLETLRDGEKLSVQAIEGLSKLLEELNAKSSRVVSGGLISKRIRFVDDETPGGTVNGVNTDFTITRAPETGSLKVYVNGQRQRVTTDYTFSGKTISFLTAPPTNSILLVDFRY